jgi:CrcB protein
LLIAIGGGLGSILRHAINQASTAFFGPRFPYGTLLVNVAGSFAAGLVAGWFALRGHHPATRLFLATGVLGGFTTFSAFSLDAALLLERGDTIGAAFYVGSSVGGAIVGVAGGLWVVRSLLP